MTGLAVVLLVGLVVAGAGVAAVAALVMRNRQRRNRVVPDVATQAPSSWAGAHTPLARLHRRLRAAVEAVRAVPDPDGALISARVEVEQAALAVDEHLVALNGLAERERATRMAQATAAVASVEEAAARLADAASASRSTALPAVEQALERAARRGASSRRTTPRPFSVTCRRPAPRQTSRMAGTHRRKMTNPAPGRAPADRHP